MKMTDRTRLRIWARDKFKCQYCGFDAGASPDAFYRASLTVDHLKPKKHGGTDDDKNLKTVCHPCNRFKSQEDLGPVQNVQRFLRLYQRECARPWYDEFVAAYDPSKDPLKWNAPERLKTVRKRFKAGDDEKEVA
jgi:hypothetical protein